MVDDARIKKIVKEVLKKSFFDYYSKAQKKTKHLVLDRIFPEQRRISSYISGLQTSLGTKFWENIAKELAIKNAFRIINNSELEQPRNIPNDLSNLIIQTKAYRENTGGSLINFKNQLNELYSEPNLDEEYITMRKGKGTDLILRKNEEIYIFDIKTVQVNANNGNTFNESVLLWTAYYKFKFGVNANNIHAGFVFPYNSSDELNDSQWWKKYGDRIKPLTNDDVYVGNQFWELLTDNTNAINAIINAVDELAEDSEFHDLFMEVFSCETQEELESFAKKVRVKEVEMMRQVEFMSSFEEITTFNVNYRWKHSEQCVGFEARLNQLRNSDSFICPTCGKEIFHN